LVPQSFAQALQERLGGGTLPAVDDGDQQTGAGTGGPAAQAQPAAGAGSAAAGSPPPPPLPGGSGARNKIVRVVMAAAIVLALLEAVRRLRSR